MDRKLVIAIAILFLLVVLLAYRELKSSGDGETARKKRVAAYVKSLWWKDVRYFAGLYRLPEKRVAAIIAQESAGNPNAKGAAGEVGLMQLMPGTIKEVNDTLKLDKTIIDLQHTGGFNFGEFLFGDVFAKGKVNYFDARVNIQYGCAYLSMLLEREGSIDEATRRYNGSGAMADEYLKQVKEFEAYF
jgi:soluble lytic murein transglycosylase-like protein